MFPQGQVTAQSGEHLGTSPPLKKSAMRELFGENFADKATTKKTFETTVEEEVAFYQAAAGIPVDGDPLEWWRKNECNYPHIARMARRYLAVPATSVPSERVFSAAGDIVSAKRSTLSPENADILIFLKKNLKL